jgi:predicted transcriptional regulator
VKEAMIVLGREKGITNRELAEALGLGASAVTRRVEAARARSAQSSDLVKLRKALRSRVRSNSNVNKVKPDPSLRRR